MKKNDKKKSTPKLNKAKNTNEKQIKKKDENAYKVIMPEQVISARAYLEQTVSSVIQEALLELVRRKPDNPLEFVGNYILDKAKKTK